jgi:hypothetical protein
VKVIGADFGRTGTTSLKAALEKLSFGPCHHMTEAQMRLGIKALRALSTALPVALPLSIVATLVLLRRYV